MADGRHAAAPVRALLRAPESAVDLRAVDPSSTPGVSGGRAGAAADIAGVHERLADAQERLFAHGRAGGTRRLLLVLQGMDTSGKGGVLRHVVGVMDPQGVRIAAFGPPTAEERAHHFLWRIRRRLPAAGMVGAFDRSHYEDVVVPRVRDLAPDREWRGRYRDIVAFERELVADGVRVVKCFLHISREESRERLLARLDNPAKHWKFDPGDIDERTRWDAYGAAYEDIIERCGPGAGAPPWYIVPADRKWYRNWAVSHILSAELEDMGLSWPRAGFDVAAERARLLAQDG